MAIGADATIEIFGTQDDLDSSSAAVSDGAFSIASDLAAWTNDDDAPMASVVLNGTYASAPDPLSVVNLFAKLDNIDGTNDQDVPDANFRATYLGSFLLNDVTSAQTIAIDVQLPNTKSSQEYVFYIENKAGQTLSAGWSLLVTPKTRGPHA